MSWVVAAKQYEIVKAKRDQARRERDELISQVKQHRNATESRLRLLAGAARQPESSDLMLKPDRDLYEVIDRIQGGDAHNAGTPPQRGNRPHATRGEPIEQDGLAPDQLQANSKQVQNLDYEGELRGLLAWAKREQKWWRTRHDDYSTGRLTSLTRLRDRLEPLLDQGLAGEGR